MSERNVRIICDVPYMVEQQLEEIQENYQLASITISVVKDEVVCTAVCVRKGQVAAGVLMPAPAPQGPRRFQ
jgi:hypothetical protein